MTVKRWITEKAFITIVGFIVFFYATEAFNITPQPVRDTVSWFGDSFLAICFTICFGLGCYTLVRLFGNRDDRR